MSEADNNDGVTSKIEQIRIDLERKMAALESSKAIKDDIVEADSIDNIISNNIEIEKKEIEIASKDLMQEEIILKETIKETIQEEVTLKPVTPNNEKPEETIDPLFEDKENLVQPVFEISDAIETIQTEEIISSSINDKNIVEFETEKNNFLNPEVEITEEKTQPNNIITPTVDSDYDNTSINEDFDDRDSDYDDEHNEEDSSSNTKFILYGLLATILLTTAYFSFDFFSKSKSLESDKMNRIISQYKNKSYLDSIELADANNQLLDIQNQNIIDSVALSIQQELSNKSRIQNSNNKVVTSKVNYSNQPISKSLKLGNIPTNSVVNNTKSTIEVVDVPADDVPVKVDKIDDKANEIKNNVEKNLKNTDLKSKPENKSTNVSTEDLKPKTPVKPKVVKSPIFPGCEKKKSEFERKKCSTSKIIRHIQRKFNGDVAQDLGLKTGMYKVKVTFVIDKTGNATVLRVRTNDKRLKAEAIRVVQSLPKMTPGRADGKRAVSNYTVPIQFTIEE